MIGSGPERRARSGAAGARAASMNRRLGILAMLGAVAIYGANFGISRHALLNGLTPDDLVALRYGIAGTLLLPVFIRRGVADCAGIGWGGGGGAAGMRGRGVGR